MVARVVTLLRCWYYWEIWWLCLRYYERCELWHGDMCVNVSCAARTLSKLSGAWCLVHWMVRVKDNGMVARIVGMHETEWETASTTSTEHIASRHIVTWSLLGPVWLTCLTISPSNSIINNLKLYNTTLLNWFELTNNANVYLPLLLINFDSRIQEIFTKTCHLYFMPECCQPMQSSTHADFDYKN